MGNISISAPLKNSSQMTYITPDDSSASAVEFICGNDTGAPVQHVVIELRTASGKAVRLVIPNDQGDAVIYVDDDLV